MAIHPVILCGGSGTRLWPSSRKGYPKQFTAFFPGGSLFQQTLKRLSGPDFLAPLVLTNADFRFIATDQCAEIGLIDARVVVEPALRNTGPAILAAALMLEDSPDDLMLVAPSDHVIEDAAAFGASVAAAAAAAAEGHLVTFGVVPTRPETGYGYLELAARPEGVAAVPLARFVEKPDLATAEGFVESGKYLWNAGLFLFRVRDIIAAYEAAAPAMMKPCRAAIATGEKDLGFFRLGTEAYEAAPSDSIDYAVMERAKDIVTVPLASGWSDLGAWDALWAAFDKDADGVATQGPALAIDCEDTLLRSEEGNLQLVGVGLKNIVAIAMRDAVLVADKDRAQDVKLAVTAMKSAGVDQAEAYPRFYRPWGWYETLCLSSRFQVKRIMVKSGGILSLQSHMHRSEHWVVVGGTARVTVDDEVKLLTENQSVYIPLGAIHRMENPGKVPMVLIEVQTGAYLGEDDIIRYEDIYKRA